MLPLLRPGWTPPASLAASASLFQISSPLLKSVQKSATTRLLVIPPAASSISHIPVTPNCIPPNAE